MPPHFHFLLLPSISRAISDPVVFLKQPWREFFDRFPSFPVRHNRCVLELWYPPLNMNNKHSYRRLRFFFSARLFLLGL